MSVSPKMDKKVTSGDGVGDGGGSTCASGSHIEKLREDENWIKDEIEDAAKRDSK